MFWRFFGACRPRQPDRVGLTRLSAKSRAAYNQCSCEQKIRLAFAYVGRAYIFTWQNSVLVRISANRPIPGYASATFVGSPGT